MTGQVVQLYDRFAKYGSVLPNWMLPTMHTPMVILRRKRNISLSTLPLIISLARISVEDHVHELGCGAAQNLSKIRAATGCTVSGTTIGPHEAIIAKQAGLDVQVGDFNDPDFISPRATVHLMIESLCYCDCKSSELVAKISASQNPGDRLVIQDVFRSGSDVSSYFRNLGISSCQTVTEIKEDLVSYGYTFHHISLTKAARRSSTFTSPISSILRMFVDPIPLRRAELMAMSGFFNSLSMERRLYREQQLTYDMLIARKC